MGFTVFLLKNVKKLNSILFFKQNVKATVGRHNWSRDQINWQKPEKAVLVKSRKLYFNHLSSLTNVKFVNATSKVNRKYNI